MANKVIKITDFKKAKDEKQREATIKFILKQAEKLNW